jgi:hypothetical protein
MVGLYLYTFTTNNGLGIRKDGIRENTVRGKKDKKNYPSITKNTRSKFHSKSYPSDESNILRVL